jgi:hypothetical protein
MKANKKQAKATKLATINAGMQAAGKEVETVQAATLSLDKTNKHSVRAKAAAESVDLFALHACKKVSTGYVDAVLALCKGRDTRADSAQKRNRFVTVNGVCSLVTVLDEGSGLYVREDSRFKTLYGSTVLLAQLHGAQCETHEAIAKRASEVKETSTLLVKKSEGKGNEEISGKLLASYDDKRVLFVDLGNGKFAVHSKELGRNANQTVMDRAVLVRGK